MKGLKVFIQLLDTSELNCNTLYRKTDAIALEKVFGRRRDSIEPVFRRRWPHSSINRWKSDTKVSETNDASWRGLESAKVFAKFNFEVGLALE